MPNPLPPSLRNIPSLDERRAPTSPMKPYATPQLTPYGTLRQLTRSGTGSNTESGPNAQGKCGGGPKKSCL